MLGVGCALFIVALALAGAVLNRFSAPDTAYSILGLAWMIAMGLHIVGAGLGIEGLRRGERKRAALSGLALNAFSILLWTMLIPVMLSESP